MRGSGFGVQGSALSNSPSFPSPIRYRLFAIAYSLSPIRYRLFPIAYCLSPIAYRLLPIAYIDISAPAC